LQKLKESGKSIEESSVKSEQIADLSNLIHKQVISGNQGKDIFEEMWASGKTASDLVKEKGI
jgi:aspartyl-tRNA(Asn)/glutamyl-tRNA(Gln) amidotransferase subunit B